MDALPWNAIGVTVASLVAIGTAMAALSVRLIRYGQITQRVKDIEAAANDDRAGIVADRKAAATDRSAIFREFKDIRKAIDRNNDRIDKTNSRIDELIRSLAPRQPTT